MLSKSATMLLGLKNERPLNAYEITKQLQVMNVQWWYNIANSTVYATLKSLEKKQYICGIVEKEGNMPDKTVYSLTEKGKRELLETLKQSILSFDYDTNIFSIAAFFIEVLNDSKELLSKRLTLLNSYRDGIIKQIQSLENVSAITIANIERSKLIVEAEIAGTEKLLSAMSNGNRNLGKIRD